MMSVVFKLTLAVALTFGALVNPFGPQAAAPEPTVAAPVFGLAIHSDPSPALVFIDGAFMGQTHPDAAFEIVLDRASCQLRLSESGRLDGVHDITLEAGRRLEVKAELCRPGEPWSIPEKPVMVRVGQPLRGVIGKDGKGPTYVIDETEAPHRMLVGLSNRLSYEVSGPDGGSLTVDKLALRPAGTPGEAFHVFTGLLKGTYTVKVAGRPGPFSMRYVKGLPPLVETDDPRLKGRRAPPR